MIVYPDYKIETPEQIKRFAKDNQFDLWFLTKCRVDELIIDHMNNLDLYDAFEKFDQGREEHKTSSFLLDVDHYEELKAEVLDCFWYTTASVINSHYHNADQ